MSSGFTRDDSSWPQSVQDRAKTLGITPNQYMQIAINLPSGSSGSLVNNSDSATYQAVAKQVQLYNAMGGAKSGSSTSNQSTQPTQPTYSSVDQNPMYDLSRLGASALGQQEIVNATPGPADKKSGIGTVNQPQISPNKVTAPQGPWDTVSGLFKKADTPQPVQTQALTPTPQATAASTVGGGAADFGTQIATNAIQQEIQRQLAQGNAFASTGQGPEPGWKPTTTGQPQGAVTPPQPNPVQTNLPPPAPVDTSNTMGQALSRTVPALTSAITSAIGGAAGGAQGGPAGSVGAFGAAGGGAASDWNSRFGGSFDPSSLTNAQKMQMLGRMSSSMQAGQNAASQWAQNAGNAFKPVASAIPGPEDFQNRGNTVALQRPTVV